MNAKKFFIIKIIIVLAIVSSCANKQFALNDYLNLPVKFPKQLIKYPEEKFEIFAPHQWRIDTKNYNNIEMISFGLDILSQPDTKNVSDKISIQKHKGYTSSKKIEDEFSFLLKNLQQDANAKIIDSGITDFFDTITYHIRYESDVLKYRKTEIIIFITADKNSEGFYTISAKTSRNEKAKTSMAIMLQCLRTFNQTD